MAARTGERPQGVVERLAQRSPEPIDQGWLSHTIGTIYDCAIRPEGWRAALTDITQTLGFENAMMGIARFREPTSSILVNAGADSDYVQKFPGYLADSVELWGGQKIADTWPLEEPAIASQLIPLERKKQNRYYVDLLEPRGFTEGVVLPIARQPDMFASIGFNRHYSVGDVTPEVETTLRLLAPHFRRAVTIGNLLDLQTVERATFESVLAAMECGVVLAGADLGVVYANPSASTILSEGGIVAERNGRLILRGPHAQSSLEQAVRLAAEDESKMSRRGIGVPAQGVDGRTFVLNVLPLTGGAVRPGLHQRAVAAVFIASTDRALQVPVDAIALLYDFTPTESLIFASLAKGSSLEQTAETLGIAKSTARTHLLRLFDKTGCNRQAELVAMAAKHAPAL